MLGKSFEVVTQLVATCGVSKKDAFTAIGGLVEKVADIKLKAPAAEALFAISETLGPQFTCTQLHKKAAAHKNPKVLQTPDIAALTEAVLMVLHVGTQGVSSR